MTAWEPLERGLIGQRRWKNLGDGLVRVLFHPSAAHAKLPEPNMKEVKPMGSSDLQSRTVEGLLAYCDWLMDKGYAPVTQVDPWKTAIRKVFETVEGETYLSLDLSDIDLAEYLARFQTLAGSQYKAESIVTYGRRLTNAKEAHEHYLSTGRPPTFKRASSSPKKDGEAKPRTAQARSAQAPASVQGTTPMQGPTMVGSSLVDYPFPLKGGQMAQLRLPARLDKADVDRLSAFLRTLQAEEQAQIPRRTGEAEEDRLAA